MPLPPPPPGFQLDGPGAAPLLGGRPIIRKGADPVKPDLPQGYGMQPGGTAAPVPGLPAAITTPESYRPITPKERSAFGLDPKKPFAINVKTGKPELIGEGKDAESTADPELAQSIKNLGLDEWLTNVTRAREKIKTGFATGVLGSLAGHFPGTPRQDFLGSLEGIKGASILEKLSALREQSKNGSSGMGSLTEQEGERLANSIASLNPNMSAEELNKSLDIIERHAKSLQAIGAGEDPTKADVQKKYGIGPLPGSSVTASGGGAGPADVNPIANNTPGDQGPQLGASGGETRSIIDPKKQALGQKIVGLVSGGADKNTILGFAVRADPSLRADPKFRGWVDDALAYRKQHPRAKFSIDPEFYTSEVPLSDAGVPGFTERDMTRAAQGAGGAGAINAANAVTAGNLDKLVGDQPAQLALATAQAQHPNASLAGSVGGGATAALGLEGLLGGLGMAPSVGRGVLADTGYGATAGATNSDDPLMGGAKGALYALLGSVIGNKVASGVGSAVKGVTNPTVGYVAKEAPLTIGQAVSQSGRVGAAVKGIEDRLSGIPIVGDAINARRLEGLQKMNSKAFDKALEPIKETAAGQFGEQAVADAQDKVSAAFGKALGGKAASIDHGFIVDATKAKMGIEKLPDRVRDEVNNSVDEVVNNYFDDGGQISGENMQALLRELGQIKRSYQGDPLGHRIGKVVDTFTDSVENLFRRQAPDVMPQYDAAKQAYKRVSTLEDAVLRAKNSNGVFTPGQLGMSDRANTVKYGGKSAAAAGKGEFHEFQRNAQEVLPNKVPDSGTAGRIIVPAAILSAGAGADAEGAGGKGLTLAALLSLAYSRGGQRALTASVLKRGSGARAVGQAVKKSAPLLGHAAGSQAALGASRE